MKEIEGHKQMESYPMFMGQKNDTKIPESPKAIYRFQWGPGFSNVFLCTRLMDPRTGTLPPPLILSSTMCLYDCFGWFGFLNHPAYMPSSFTSQGFCKGSAFFLEHLSPRWLLTLTAVKLLLKCHPLGEPLLTVDKHHPAHLADLFPFLARIIVWHTTYLPADRSSPPARNVRAWKQEHSWFCSLQFPQHLGSVFTWRKIDSTFLDLYVILWLETYLTESLC